MHWSRAGSSTIRHRWVDTKLACCQVLVGCMTPQHPLFPSFLMLFSTPRGTLCRALLKSDDSDVLPCWHLGGAAIASMYLHGASLLRPSRKPVTDTHDEYRGCQARP
jgi:hypothetical protein